MQGRSLQARVDEYIAYRVGTRQCGQAWADAARSHLVLLARAVGERPYEDVLTREFLEGWIDTARRTLRPWSVRARVSQTRKFCQWLLLNDHLPTDPSVSLVSPRTPVGSPRAQRPAHVRKVLSRLDVRGKLIVLLMVQEGLRCMEVAGLSVDDVDVTNRMLHVHGKGGKERDLPMTDETWDALQRYWDILPPWPGGPLIRSYRDPSLGLSPEHVSKLVGRWVTEAGIKQRAWDGVSAHAFRHTAAHAVADACHDLQEVQEFLGHSSLNTTQIYLRGRMSANRLRPIVNGRRYLAASEDPDPAA